MSYSHSVPCNNSIRVSTSTVASKAKALTSRVTHLHRLQSQRRKLWKASWNSKLSTRFLWDPDRIGWRIPSPPTEANSRHLLSQTFLLSYQVPCIYHSMLMLWTFKWLNYTLFVCLCYWCWLLCTSRSLRSNQKLPGVTSILQQASVSYFLSNRVPVVTQLYNFFCYAQQDDWVETF